MQIINKLASNNEFINKQRLEGRTFCYLSELPYPKSAKRSVKNGPALDVNNSRVIFQSLEDSERSYLKTQISE